jgi:hypothetical protein
MKAKKRSMDVKVIKATSARKLEDTIELMGSRGWVPQGGIAYWQSSGLLGSRKEYCILMLREGNPGQA